MRPRSLLAGFGGGAAPTNGPCADSRLPTATARPAARSAPLPCPPLLSSPLPCGCAGLKQPKGTKAKTPPAASRAKPVRCWCGDQTNEYKWFLGFFFPFSTRFFQRSFKLMFKWPRVSSAACTYEIFDTFCTFLIWWLR